MSNSRIPGFYRLSTKERFDIVTKGCNLSENEINSLSGEYPLSMGLAG